MFFKTTDESLAIAVGFGYSARALEAHGDKRGTLPGSAVYVFLEEPRPDSFKLARMVVTSLGPFGSCLLWVREHGVWPPSENLHLYYRLRISYGDFRDIQTAPGHLFLEYERTDAITFVDLFLRFGWGGYLLGPTRNIVISHDGWMRVDALHKDAWIDRFVSDARAMSLRYELRGELKEGDEPGH